MPLDGFAGTISVVAMRSFNCCKSCAILVGAIAFNDMLLLTFVSVGARVLSIVLDESAVMGLGGKNDFVSIWPMVRLIGLITQMAVCGLADNNDDGDNDDDDNDDDDDDGDEDDSSDDADDIDTVVC